MKSIKKAVKITTIHAAEVTSENGAIKSKELPAVQTFETVTEKNAAKIVKNALALDNENIVVTGFEAVERVYTMPLAKFVQLAEVKPE